MKTRMTKVTATVLVSALAFAIVPSVAFAQNAVDGADAGEDGGSVELQITPNPELTAGLEFPVEPGEADPEGGATDETALGNVGQTAPTALAAAAVPGAIDRTNLQAVTNAYVNQLVPTLSVPVGWTGSWATCTPGVPSPEAKAATYAAVNYFRAMVGSPPATENQGAFERSQALATIMEANGGLSHYPLQDWGPNFDCVSIYPGKMDGIQDNLEILAMGSRGANNVVGWIDDYGRGNESVGHRLSLLRPDVDTLGIGLTSWTGAGRLHVNSNYTWSAPLAWPPSGYFPAPVLPDSGRWLYVANLGDRSTQFTSQPVVTVTGPNGAVAVDVEFASNAQVVWNVGTLPKPAVNTIATYHVKITGAATPVEYDVNLFTPPSTSIGAVTVTGNPYTGHTATASVSGVTPANAQLNYQWVRVTWGYYETPIPGATGTTYTFTDDDITDTMGTVVAAKVTATADGYLPSSTRSNPLSVRQRPMPDVTCKIVPQTHPVAGLAAGYTVAPDCGADQASVASATYDWYLGGVPYRPDYHQANLVLPADAVGKELKVVGTFYLSDYRIGHGEFQNKVLKNQPHHDVAPTSNFAADIDWLITNKITNGYDDGTFRPGDTIKRNAFAAFLHRVAGSPVPELPDTPTFSDVPHTGQNFHQEIEWLATQNIVRGYADGSFKPGGTVNRDAMAAFLYRAAGYPPFTPPATPSFKDIAGNTFYLEIEWLAQTGITSGYADGTFRPGSAITREAMAAFLHRGVDKGLLFPAQ